MNLGLNKKSICLIIFSGSRFIDNLMIDRQLVADNLLLF